MATKNTPSSIEFDKLYQDEALDLLNSLGIGQSIKITFLDGRAIASSLLDAIDLTSDVFLSAQAELVYGKSNTDYHLRPNIIEEHALLNYLEQQGFHSESIQNEASKPGYRTLVATRIHDKPIQATGMSKSALPEYTESFYPAAVKDDRREYHGRLRQALPKPKVLNIGSGSDVNKQLPHAINVDISPLGEPDVVVDGIRLPFRDGEFTVVMASHVLEHFPPDQIPSVIREWKRVLHPQGLLRVAVPDGEMALRELETGKTKKKQPCYSVPGGSAPLTQVVGLGGENSRTDSRWRHQILFTKKLLKEVLQSQGLEEVEGYDNREALSYLCDTNIDETNSYSYKVEAQRKREPHRVSQVMTEEEYLNLKAEAKWEQVGPLSILIPMHNESKQLPAFFKQLEGTLKELDSLEVECEVIFIANGCTDNSPKVLQRYVNSRQDKRIRMTKSDKGILNAFRKGLRERKKQGLIAKIDIDTSFDYWTVPLLINEIISDQKKQVTYAEVCPLEETPNRFNMAEFFQDFRTVRLYYHGRVSLYRTNPFDYFPEELVAEAGTLVEDMIFSCLYAYYFGLDSMGPAKGALVKSTQPTSFDMGIRKFDRCKSEIEKIEQTFPQLRILSSVMKRVETEPEVGVETYSLKAEMWSAYHSLHQAMSRISKLSDGMSSEVKEWERLR